MTAHEGETKDPSRERPIAHAVRLRDDETVVIDGRGDDPVWERAQAITWDTDYSGQSTGVVTRVKIAWSPAALYMLWELEAAEFNSDLSYPIDQKRMKLFEEDAVEVFLGSADFPKDRYYEIEVGPFGHFLDLEIELSKGKADWDWSSQVRAAATRDERRHTATIEFALEADDIAVLLSAGERLPLGLYRLEGAQIAGWKDDRYYLAWSPTKTDKPNFHVPKAFGTLVLDP